VGGLLFVGSAETIHVPQEFFESLNKPFTFAYQKLQPQQKSVEAQTLPVIKKTIASLSVDQKNLIKTDSSKKNESDLIRARRLANLGKLDESILLAQKYLKEFFLSIEAHILLGELYQASSDSSKAEESFLKALYLDPNNVQALNYLLLLKEQKGDPKEVKILKKRLERLKQTQKTS